MSQALGCDIGGSSVKSAVVETATATLVTEPIITRLVERPTPSTLIECLAGIVRSHNWTGPLGIGYPGVIKMGITLSAAHVDDSFIGIDWYSRVNLLSPGPVVLLNDADAAGLAEMQFGAGRSYNHTGSGTVLMSTFGSGIGTALFHGGRLVPNSEFGHMIVGNEEAEEFAAGAVFTRLELDWSEYGRRVDRFLRAVGKLVSPDLIIIGGGISENFELFGRYLTVNIPTVPAVFKNTAGLVGAAWAAAQPDQVGQ